MKRVIGLALPLAAFAVALLAGPVAPPALAQEGGDEATMSWYFRNESGRDLAVELYAQDRRLRWPGGDKVYLLEKSQNKAIPITCRSGERICWGGWANGDDRIAYGTGFNGRADCADCCRICVGSAVETVPISPRGAE